MTVSVLARPTFSSPSAKPNLRLVLLGHHPPLVLLHTTVAALTPPVVPPPPVKSTLRHAPPGYHPLRILLCIAMVALTPPLVSSSSLKSSLCLARPSPSTSQQRSPRDHHYIGLDVLSFHPQRHDGMVPCSPLSPPPPLPPTQSRPALKTLATMTTPRSLLLPYLLRPLLLPKLLRFTFALDLVLVVAATI